ncbi:MAG: hypothetical protein HRU11_12160 [Parvularculaceae bacterium]|nr:hypothetical protein [Parvularculaceae bacterium]
MKQVLEAFNLAKVIGEIADDLHTSGEEKGELDLKAKALALKAQELQNSIALAQIEVEKTQAQHGSWFVAGARPAQIWAGVLAGLIAALLFPIVNGVGANLITDWQPLVVPWEALTATGLLSGGTAVLRTQEKLKGVARGRIR